MPRSGRLPLAVAAAWPVAPSSAFAIADGEDADAPCFAPGSLHQADLRLLSRRACARSHPGALDRTMLCSSDPAGPPRAHACPGDSGSPMAVREHGRWRQVGAGSWGAEVTRRRCDDTRLPLVMADVAALRGWIDRTIRRLDP